MLVAGLVTAGAFASEFTATSGSWFDPANWQPQRVPDASDDVVISGKKTVNAEGDIVAASLSLGSGATLNLGSKTLRMNVSATVEGDLTIEGGSKFRVYSGELINSNVFYEAYLDQAHQAVAIAELWASRNIVSVGGTFSVAGNSTVYADFAPLTATPIAFACDAFVLAEGSTVTSKGLGWYWSDGPASGRPAGAKISRREAASSFDTGWTWAFGCGQSYFTGAGYGAAGRNAGTWGNMPCGSAYGSAYAPFLSGSPAGFYRDRDLSSVQSARGSGAITIYAKTSMTVDGTVDADCQYPGSAATDGYGTTSTEYGSASGGGIWLATGADAIAFGECAALRARGGGTASGTNGWAAGGRIALTLGVTAAQMDVLAGGTIPAGFFGSELIEGVSADVAGACGYTNGVDDTTFLTGTKTTVSPFKMIPVVISGGGSVSVGGVTHTESFAVRVRSGESVSLTAVAGTGVSFLGWSGDAFPDGVSLETTVSVDVDETGLVASFGSPSVAVPRTWTGAKSTQWMDGRNWTPAGVPGPADAATLSGSSVKFSVTNSVAVGSLTLGDGATLYVGGSDIQKSEFTERRTAATIATAGDLTVYGGARLVVYASELEDLTPFATAQQDNATNLCAQLWIHRKTVSVGGNLVITGSGSAVVPDAAPITGRPVVFEVGGDFTLAASAALDASSRGWMWSTNAWSTHPDGARRRYESNTVGKDDGWCLAPGVGGQFAVPGAYGAGVKLTVNNVDYGCSYWTPYAPFVPGSPANLYLWKDDFFNPAKPEIKQAKRGGGAAVVIAKGMATVNGTVSAAGGTRQDYCGNSGGGIWLVAKGFAFGSSAKLNAKGGISYQGYRPGAGGRIAIGQDVGVRQFAKLTTHGRLRESKNKGLSAFAAAYPGVTVNVDSGDYGNAAGTTDATLSGTFAWYEAPDCGLMLIFR